MIYAFLDYELDTQLYELRHAGQGIALEPAVFKVLLYLIRHRERAVSKQECLEHLWMNQCVGEWALVQSIVKGRRAVGDDGRAQRCIQTVRGYGYRFVARVEERPTVAHATPHPLDLPDARVPDSGAGATLTLPGCDMAASLLFPERTQELMALYELLGLAQTRLASILRLSRLDDAWPYEPAPSMLWQTS